MKKMLLFLLMLMLAAACTLAAADSGEMTCGNYTFTLQEDGTAMITSYNGNEFEVTIPTELNNYKVTGIGAWAFSSCINLSDVTIPDSVTNVADNPFSNCSNLSRITVSLEHPTLAVIEGALYYKPERVLLCYPAELNAREYVIPQGIARIDDSSFSGARHLVSLTVPSSVAWIGNYAFQDCTSLENVTLAEGVADICHGAFNACTALRSITLPDSVKLNDNPFIRCTALESIAVSETHPTLAVKDGVLFSVEDNRLIVYPCTLAAETYEVPQGTVTIESHAFSHGRMNTIVIPDSVTEIGTGAFECCRSLRAVNIPASVTSFGDYIFDTCPLVTVTLTRKSALVSYLKEDYISYTYSDLYDWLAD